MHGGSCVEDINGVGFHGNFGNIASDKIEPGQGGCNLRIGTYSTTCLREHGVGIVTCNDSGVFVAFGESTGKET